MHIFATVIRITVEETNKNVCLIVEGKLSGPSVPEFEDFALKVRESSYGKAVDVDVSGVSRMDAAGRSLVARLRTEGLRIRNLDPLSETLLTMQLAEVGAAR